MEPDAARDVAAPSPVKKSHGIEFKEVKFSEFSSELENSSFECCSRGAGWRPRTTWARGGGRPRCLRSTTRDARCWFISQVG